MRDLSLQVHSHQRVTVIDVQGDVDIYTVPKLRNHLREEILRAGRLEPPRPAVVVNLEDLSFIDSTGLGCLVTKHKLAQAEGVEFSVAVGRHKQIFVVTGLTRFFDLYRTRSEAVRGRDRGPLGS